MRVSTPVTVSIVYDTLAHQSTIQVIGLGIYSAALSVYNGLQYNQLRDIAGVLTDNDALRSEVWPLLRGMIISTVVITASFTFWIQCNAWKLYEEFAWVTPAKSGSEYTNEAQVFILPGKKTFSYSVIDIALTLTSSTHWLLLSLLKFDGFFFLGFLLQLAIQPFTQSDPTFVAAVTLMPISCCLLFTTAWVVRHEYRVGTIVISVLQLALIGFFIYMFTVFYSPSTYQSYLQSQMTLTFFGITTIVLPLGIVTMICLCFQNFGQGLRPYVSGGVKARLLGETFEMQLREGYLRVPHEAT
ncbi:hypothetical protein BDV33DRAFT_186204 [Aspergillus novoparasiticus]|uniref:Uncharacterized protein n=1 Tax=Aspergillus novoparasiticus TaxID=986946 RepID=A0A5N6E6L4_9EURO|nr:hypothetical protein BDV33DRAFT_186204 [Aspergillus novoparasiticus]